MHREAAQKGRPERKPDKVALSGSPEKFYLLKAWNLEIPWVNSLFYVKYARRKYEIVDKPAFVVTQRRQRQRTALCFPPLNSLLCECGLNVSIYII